MNGVRTGGPGRAVGALLVGAIRLYQRWLSPLKPPTCRFTPTCSEYAVQAVLKHGPLRGSALAAWRVVRCGPWSAGGYDPVP
ncbi:MAG: membrane protein insertion efficiency factor YidD [Clostridia bacterium]|nr:membrane protein insertion efficiency factor YidD [Clostridia bacterium]MCL6521869.1 membrane protein insertion efficiency factor YidD [Bacillota bacterium]